MLMVARKNYASIPWKFELAKLVLRPGQLISHLPV